MLNTYLMTLMQKQSLTASDCQRAIEILCDGASPAQAAAFLALLHSKPETVDELTGIIAALMAQMIAVPMPRDTILLDIVGTGGDHSHSVNISTAAALLVASLGVPVAKHGNYAISSRAGAADVLKALKIPMHTSAAAVQMAIEKHSFAFLLASHFHPVMKKINPLRQQLGVPTTFNMVGPLLNPARPSHLIIGVYRKTLMPLFADVLQKQLITRALIVHGEGMDEISCAGPIDIIEVTPSQKKFTVLDPQKFGLTRCDRQSLKGGDAETNKNLLLDAFSGKPGPISDTIILNAAVALQLVQRCESIEAGIAVAKTAMHQGHVLSFIHQLQETSTCTNT